MKTSLGLNFLRIVNEEGVNGWAQVYARVPFDDFELKEKGALFGVVFSKNIENWADKETELMSWVDEYFNGVGKEDLRDFGDKFLNRYSDIESVWLWVETNGSGDRVMKIFRTGGGSIRLMRNGSGFDLGRNILEGKVLAGPIKEGDRLIISIGGLDDLLPLDGKIDEEKVNVVSQKLLGGNVAAAGLEFTFEKYDPGVVTVSDEVPVMVEREAVESRDDGLVSERIVGPVKFGDRVKMWFERFRTQGRTIRIHRPSEKRKRVAVILGLIFLSLLVISIVMGSVKLQAERESKKWREFSEPIEKSRQEAVDMVGINLVGSRKLLEDVKITFETRKGEFLKTKYKDDVVALEKKIAESWETASGEKQSNVDYVLNLSLVRSGVVGDRVALAKKGSFLILDSLMGIVMTSEIATKDIKVVGGKGEGQGWLDVAFDGKKNLLLSNTTIKSVEKGTDLVTFDATVAKPIAMGTFGGSVYILDQMNKEIYKYAPSGEGLGERQRWLKQDESIGVDPVDMAIDGDIWILGTEGKIEKFRRGAKESFSVGSSVGNLSPFKLAVEVDGERLAVLDIVNSQISIFKKEDGSFVQQLKSGDLKTAKDIEFDNEGNLWVLNGGQVGILR